jgi:hypothetical protein
MTAKPIQYVVRHGAPDELGLFPVQRFRAEFDLQFESGEEYPLGIIEHASDKSRGHYFVVLQEIYSNLPETEKRFPTWEHLRHWALVEAGFCAISSTVMDTPKDAKMLAGAVRVSDPYAVIVVRENVVRIARAKSQSKIAMKSVEFQQSKEAVLNICSALVPGIDRSELKKRADHLAGHEKRPNRQPETGRQPPADGPPVGLMAPEGPVMAAEPKERASEAPIGPPRSRVPTTAAEYFTYARDFAMAEPDKNKRWRKWDDEKDLRDELKVPVQRRIELTNLLNRLDKESP